nr:DUF3822 family protein [uncultured Mucilaginibacter sp.]
MGQINYTYKHEDFNLNMAYYYTLILQVSSADFTYAVIYNDNLMALADQCSLEELANPVDMADELSAHFADVVVGVDALAFTLVPTALFSTDKVGSFARFLDVKQGEKVLAQQLDADNYIVYKTTDKVIKAIEKFDLNRCVHSSKGWINAIANSNPVDTTIYINIEQGSAEFLYFKNGKIRLYNTFQYNTADDLAYTAALVLKETGLDQTAVQLRLSGTAQDEEHKARLAEFFPVVELNTIKIAELPDELNSAVLLKLSALLLCVSSEAR